MRKNYQFCCAFAQAHILRSRFHIVVVVVVVIHKICIDAQSGIKIKAKRNSITCSNAKKIHFRNIFRKQQHKNWSY